MHTVYVCKKNECAMVSIYVSIRQYVKMSICEIVNMPICQLPMCQYANESICQYVNVVDTRLAIGDCYHVSMNVLTKNCNP